MRSKPLDIWSFGLDSSFVIRHSDFGFRILSFFRGGISNLNLTTSARLFDKGSGSAANLLPHTRLRRNKLRREPWKQADQIVCDENLSVAMLARTNADGRDPDRVCDLLRDVGEHNLEHH